MFTGATAVYSENQVKLINTPWKILSYWTLKKVVYTVSTVV